MVNASEMNVYYNNLIFLPSTIELVATELKQPMVPNKVSTQG